MKGSRDEERKKGNRESEQEEETDMVRRIYSANNYRDPLAGEGSVGLAFVTL